jgi:hypothetical protein
VREGRRGPGDRVPGHRAPNANPGLRAVQQGSARPHRNARRMARTTPSHVSCWRVSC